MQGVTQISLIPPAFSMFTKPVHNVYKTLVIIAASIGRLYDWMVVFLEKCSLDVSYGNLSMVVTLNKVTTLAYLTLASERSWEGNMEGKIGREIWRRDLELLQNVRVLLNVRLTDFLEHSH